MGFHIHCSRFRYTFALFTHLTFWREMKYLLNQLSHLNWTEILSSSGRYWVRNEPDGCRRPPRNWKQLYLTHLRWVVLCSFRERFVKVSTKLTLLLLKTTPRSSGHQIIWEDEDYIFHCSCIMCQITFNLPKQNNLVTVEVQSEFPTEITWKSY